MVKESTIWSYVVAYDGGTAPCVDNNLLSLCICKPMIRRSANVGDWIIGFTRRNIGVKKICYVAEVTKKISMEEYFLEPKKRSDKIYKYNNNDFIHNGGNIHSSPKHWRTDLGGKFCLISRNFWYFGDKFKKLPSEINELYYPYVGQKKNTNQENLEKLKNFLGSYEVGIQGKPLDKKIKTKSNLRD